MNFAILLLMIFTAHAANLTCGDLKGNYSASECCNGEPSKETAIAIADAALEQAVADAQEAQAEAEAAQAVAEAALDAVVGKQFDVSWSDLSKFHGGLMTDFGKQLVSGNFKPEWTVNFPMVDVASELDAIRTTCMETDGVVGEACTATRRAKTFSYSIFDQSTTYPTCRGQSPEMRATVFSNTLAVLGKQGVNVQELKLRYHSKCFDLDIAGERFDVMDFTFDKLTRFGYRLTILAGKSCVEGQIPFFNIYGKTLLTIEAELTSTAPPSWEDIHMTGYTLSVPTNSMGPGKYDVYVGDSQFLIPAVPTDVTRKYAGHKFGSKALQHDDHVVRLTLGVESTLVDATDKTLDTCSFKIDKIYFNEKTYNMVV